MVGFVADEYPVKKVNYTIVEELDPGTFVGDIFNDSHIEEKYRPDELKGIQFHLLRPDQLFFVLEKNTSIIRTGKQIDRDVICHKKLTCFVELSILATVPGYRIVSEMIIVLVVIEDINDNWPKFPVLVMSKEILETRLLGTEILLPNAIDKDSGTLGIRTYRLVGHIRPFKLFVTENVAGSTEVRLVLQELLDYEKTRTYNMHIGAIDGGDPHRTGWMILWIHVLNANDNIPIFDNKTYLVDIPENIHIYSTIVQIHAHDRDLGIFGQVTYKFSDHTENMYGQLFRIQNVSGEIVTNGIVDYEISSVYHLEVIAHDQGPDSSTAVATIIITILDINDSPPIIEITTIICRDPSSGMGNILESGLIGTFVAHFTVIDYDTGLNGNVSCGLNNNDFCLEYVDHPKGYKIFTNVQLDRERIPYYSLGIRCRDMGVPHLSSLKYIPLQVTDDNDHNPVFLQEGYLSNLMENNYIGAFITQVNATDKDIGQNAEIYYVLHPDAGKLFNIGASTGIVTTNAVFDREKCDQIQFHVLAVDKGQPPRTGTVLVVLHINDLDDEKPIFSESSSLFWVNEKNPAGTTVGTVFASDLDEEPHNKVKYSLIPSGMGADNFTINSRTGKITTLTSLDREIQSAYYVVIVATDSGILPFSSSITATIYVLDENNNGLIFAYPTPKNNTIRISNMAPIGFTIATVVAVYPENTANLSYYLIRGRPNDPINTLFGIESRTGDIKVGRSLREIECAMFQIVIKVKDLDLPERTNSANFNIIVNNSIPFLFNDHPLVSGHNLSRRILIGLVCGSGVLMVVLVTSIILIYKKLHAGKTYNCQKETLNFFKYQPRSITTAIHGNKLSHTINQ